MAAVSDSLLQETERPRLWRRLWPPLLIVAAVLVLFGRQLFTGGTVIPVDVLCLLAPWSQADFCQGVVAQDRLHGDALRELYPWLDYFFTQVKGGTVPLWNPLIMDGTPFVGMPWSAVFYPFMWLFLPLSSLSAYTWFFAFHVAVAGLGMYFLLRELKLSGPAAALGGITFMFGHTFIQWSVTYPNVTAMAWLPLVFLFAEKTLKRPRLWSMSAMALFLALGFLGGGHLQFLYYGLLATVFYAGCRLVMIWRDQGSFRAALRPGALVACGIALGLGLAAVQMLPVFKQTKEIVRTGESAKEVGAEVQGSDYLIYLVVPKFLGAADDTYMVPPHDGRLGYDGERYMNSGYVSIAALFLVPLAVFGYRSRKKWIFVAMLTGSFILAFLPLANELIYYLLPFYKNFRNPPRWFYIYVFAAAVLAGMGAQALLQTPRQERLKRVARAVLVAVAAAASLLVVFFLVKYRAWDNPLISRRYMSVQLALAGFMGIATIGAIWWAVRSESRRQLALLALLAVTLFDGLVFLVPSFAAEPGGDGYPLTPGIAWLQDNLGEHRFMRYEGQRPPTPITPAITPDTAMLFGLQDTQGSTVFIYRRYVDFLNLMEDHGEHAKFNELPSITDYQTLDSPLLDLMGVRYVITFNEEGNPQLMYPSGNSGYRLVHDEDRMRVYENLDVLPRAFVAPAAVVSGSDEEAAALVGEPAFRPADEVVLESWQNPPAVSGAAGGEAEITAYGANSVTVETRGRGWLVLSDTYAEGWRAEVNGARTPIYRADYNFRAVPLEQDSATVVFSYEPPGFRTGAYISIGALLVIVAGLLSGARPFGRRVAGGIE